MTLRTALLFADDPALRPLVEPLLAARGFTVREARTLQGATQVLGSLPEPPVLTVVGELADGSANAWLRALAGPVPERPVLFVSSRWKGLRADRDLRQQLAGLVHLSLVHQPILADALAGRLDELLERASAPALPLELGQVMAQLKTEYGEGMPAKLEELRKLVRRARGAPDDDEARKAARTAAHKLAGTAGSYGFPEESLAAAVVEAQALQAARLPAGEERAACWAAAESALEEAVPLAAAPAP